jgi:hypothetical protein
MMKVRLNSDEVAYLRRRALLSLEILARATRAGEGAFLLDIPDVEADQLRDACGEELQRIGFDESYNPTKEGVLLEGLIDKLLVPVRRRR